MVVTVGRLKGAGEEVVGGAEERGGLQAGRPLQEVLVLLLLLLVQVACAMCVCMCGVGE